MANNLGFEINFITVIKVCIRHTIIQVNTESI